jgi:uncharacterized protein (DUF58 family)
VTLAPARRLVAAVAMWTGGAVLAVVWPALWGPLGGAIAVLAALVAYDATMLRRAGPVTVERVLPERAAVGRAAEVTIRVRNGGATALVADVVDELPRDLVADEPRFDAVTLGGEETVVLRHAIRPAARGDRVLGPVIVVLRSRLGLCRRLVVVPAGRPLRVYPDVTRFVRREALDLRRVLAALGVRPARRRGDGMEFDSLREFVVGDDPRRVDWAATARRGRPITRLYRHERRHTVMIALDASRLMGGRVGEQSKLDHAVDAALALAHAALVSGDRVGMLVFDREVRAYLPPRAHRRALGAFSEVCRTATPRAVEADYRALALALAVRQRQRALLVVLTDFVEADAVTLVAPALVLARRHRMLLVAVRDRAFTRLDAGAAEAEPLELYRRVVLDELLHERESVLSRLRRAGVQTIDLVPEAITGAVLNRYLELRHGPDR